MSFKKITTEPLTFLAVIYDEQYPVHSGMCWALALVDAASQDEAAAKLAHYGGDIMYGKDVELLRVPKAFVAPLRSIPRGIPIGEPNPLAEEMKAVLGDWLAETMQARRRRDADVPFTRVAVAPVDGGVVVAELTEDETAEMFANEQAGKKKPH